MCTEFSQCFLSIPFTNPLVSMLCLHTHWILKIQARTELPYRPGQVEELNHVFIAFQPTGRCTLYVGWLLIIVIRIRIIIIRFTSLRLVFYNWLNQKNSGNPRLCFNCDKKGNLARDCKDKKEESRSYEGRGRIREVERKVTDIETAVAKIASHFPSLHFPCRVPTTDSWKLKRYRKLI